MIDLKLGKLAMARVELLGALDAGRKNEYVAGKISLKEQLRELEKAMVILGWDGKAHVVRQTKLGPVIVKKHRKGHVISVQRFNTHAHINKYV